MHQGGIYSAVYSRFTRHLYQHIDVPTPVITIIDVAPILTVLSVGILLAAFVYLLEMHAKKLIDVLKVKLKYKGNR